MKDGVKDILERSDFSKDNIVKLLLCEGEDRTMLFNKSTASVTRSLFGFICLSRFDIKNATLKSPIIIWDKSTPKPAKSRTFKGRGN